VDSTRFDRISRVVGEQTDRRGMLKVVAGSALAAMGFGAFAGGARAETGFRGDSCSGCPRNSGCFCKKGLYCTSSSSDGTCQYKYECGNQQRGRLDDACRENNDCCNNPKTGQDYICRRQKCERRQR